jgi:hypothetical protein
VPTECFPLPEGDKHDGEGGMEQQIRRFRMFWFVSTDAFTNVAGGSSLSFPPDVLEIFSEIIKKTQFKTMIIFIMALNKPP